MTDAIVLINPAKLLDTKTRNLVREAYGEPPMGLLAMAGHLLMHGHAPTIIDFFRDRVSSKAAFLDRLRQIDPKPRLIGISTFTDSIREAMQIARSAREELPDVPIVLGGPHATFCYEEILSQEPAVDFVVLREGEATLIELIEHLRDPGALPLSEIRGLAYRSGARVGCNEPRPYLTHLDSLPLPPMHLIRSGLDDEEVRTLDFLSSRGCPGQCIFCASRALSGDSFRMHTAERLISMLFLHHRRSPLAEFAALDDTFVAHRGRLRAFVGYLRECGILLPWACKSRVDTINATTLGLLKESGCRSIHVGPESADDTVLASIDKRITVGRILDAIVAVRQHEILVKCSFMVGHHSDTLGTIEKTILLAQAIRDNNIGLVVVAICTPLPGTVLHLRARELGLRILTKDWGQYDINTPVYETAAFGPSDLRKAVYHFDVASRHSAEELRLSNEDHASFKRVLADFVARACSQRGQGASA